MSEYTFWEPFEVIGGVVTEDPTIHPTWRTAMIRCLRMAPPGDLTAIFGFCDIQNKYLIWNLGMSEIVAMNGGGTIDVNWPHEFTLPSALPHPDQKKWYGAQQVLVSAVVRPHPIPDQTSYEAVYRVIPQPRLTFDNRDAAIMAALHLQPTL